MRRPGRCGACRRATIWATLIVPFIYLCLYRNKTTLLLDGRPAAWLINNESKFSIAKNTYDGSKHYRVVGSNFMVPGVEKYSRRRGILYDKQRLIWSLVALDGQQVKTILSLNSDFRQANLGGCPSLPCRIVHDMEYWNVSDAVIQPIAEPNNFKRRLINQYFVFMTQESPVHASVYEPHASFYNLTMSYRRDSDLPCPYGFTVRRPSAAGAPPIAERRKAVAWVVSNCGAPSRRDELVDALQRHIDVDVFGGCGPLDCERRSDACALRLSRDYRFYGAFENSVCRDYATEKFWRALADWRLVPLVLRRADVERVAPPHSFVAADDFADARQLAAHLRRLTTDDAAYARYFDWRATHDAVYLEGEVHDARERPWGFCRLCRLLLDEPRPTRVVRHLERWWRRDAHCDNGSLVGRLLNDHA